MIDGQIPPALIEGLERYRDHGVPTGGFLEAVLKNDLQQAVQRADPSSAASLRSLTWWIQENIPAAMYGSHEAVEAWIQQH